ncbi:MAG: 2-keto-4-pentenoate hydratase [Thaumarchaeota archaeon 13_1_40CM_4_38_7]|nr:MAG: 2-keto-4-pentenoate hydratase [Thaumarchaeota archaeon 13_1_40CM_4_38_7]OLC94582.1 MAG: 2-keto-4-pentenoate hydratase [Thaumarchaeota archaeon 13_1_40CM_3_38_6]OLE39149.1 MAG: 2-keto-4-pentenoate hydratase [Thaumarchaeota archaeon 13_1_20CM_2_38_5]
MKIARLLKENMETYGFVKEDKVLTKENMTSQTGIPIPQNIKDFLFDGWYNEIKTKSTQLNYNERLSDFKLLPPIPNPSKIICLAFNYIDHAKEQNLIPPDEPAIIIKPRTTLNGATSDIICPSFVSKLDYEIELALIIGSDCKNISEKEAKEVVFGYMILNDASARDVQAKDKQFTRAKGFDTFAPCGPWITTADEIPDPQNLKMITKVNGVVRQNSSTSNMFLNVYSVVSMLSQVMTLEKGDIISTGTPAGVMLNKPDAVFLKEGDKIEMEIDGLGKLENTIRFV